jgi:hypothetical protein
MLFDRKRDKKTKKPTPSNPEPLMTIESLVAWLERQPPKQAYDWYAMDGSCLIGRYSADMGLPDWQRFHTQLFQNYDLTIAATRPWTYGAALKRARARLTGSSQIQ